MVKWRKQWKTQQMIIALWVKKECVHILVPIMAALAGSSPALTTQKTQQSKFPYPLSRMGFKGLYSQVYLIGKVPNA
jgi:hypothetical protein